MDTRDLITLVGVLTGFVGATSALISSLASYLTFKREGYIIKVTGKRSWQIMNAVPPYSEDKKYSVITVYNRGKRHANISKVGESYLFQFGGSIYSDSMIYGTTKVEEDDARDYLAEEKPNHKRPTTGYYYAVTKSGKIFKFYPHTHLAYWLCYPLRKVNRFITKKKLTKNKKTSQKKS